MWPAFSKFALFSSVHEFLLTIKLRAGEMVQNIQKNQRQRPLQTQFVLQFPIFGLFFKILQIKLRSPLIMCRSVCDMVKVNTPFPLQMHLAGSLARTRPHFPFLRQCQIPFWFLGHSRKHLPELPLMVQLVVELAMISNIRIFECLLLLNEYSIFEYGIQASK